MDFSPLSERYQKMFSPKGFCDLVNTEYQQDLRVNPRALKEDTFWRLNDEWHRLTGRYRYNDFHTFTAIESRDKKKKKKGSTGK